MIEIIRDFCAEINSKEIPQDIRKIIELQVRSVKASVTYGKKYLEEKGIIREFERKAEIFGLDDPAKTIFLNSSASVIFDWDDYLFAGHTGHSSVVVSLELGKKLKYYSGEEEGQNEGGKKEKEGKEKEKFSESGKYSFKSVDKQERKKEEGEREEKRKEKEERKKEKEKEKLSDKVLKAIWLGNEIGARFGVATLLGPLNGQMMTYLHGIISSAITSYLIFGYEKIPEKISYYISNPNFISFGGFMGGDTKIFTTSIPAVSGMLASMFEINTNKNSFSDFLSLFSFSKNDIKTLEKIFSPEFFLTRTLMIKKYPGCAYVLPQVECALAIKRKIKELCDGEFNPQKIGKIEIDYSIIPLILDRILGRFSDFSNHVWSEFSTYASVALTLVSEEDDILPSPSKLETKKHEILSMISKMNAKHNTSYTSEVIKSVVEHFNFLLDNVPPIQNLIFSAIKNSGISEIPKNEIVKTAFSLSGKIINALIQKKGKGEGKNPDEFTFVFPAKLKIVYQGKDFEEELKTHSSPAKSGEDAVEFKEKMIAKEVHER